jgi:Helix-turn-helix
VRHRREELGITQAELAERAGLQQPAVARFEAGSTRRLGLRLERRQQRRRGRDQRLRRKLGDSAGTLQTVRGAGYRFTAPP